MAVSIFGQRLRLNRSFRIFQQIRTGYVVLLPEIKPEHYDKNPLYKNGYPDIENITQEKCLTTLGKYILDFEHGVRQVENDIIGKQNELELFNDIINPIEDCSTKLEATWGLVKALYLVDRKKMPAESYLSLHERARRARGRKYQSRTIYNFLKNSDISKFSEEEQRVVTKFLTEGKLNGLNLDHDAREAFDNISKELASETSKFNKRVQVSSRKYFHVINEPTLIREFPEDLLHSMSFSSDPHEGPWKVTLDVMNKFLKYCPDRNLRWNVWLASRQVAATEASRELNNSISIEKIRALRRDVAKVLGYNSFAEMSMETKMAGTIENVQNTLAHILEIARPEQEKELNALQTYAEGHGFKGTLEMWDIPFWERKQKISVYNWDDRKMKECFPYETVLEGLINIVSNCFNLKIEQASGKTWHPSCKMYNIYEDGDTKPIATIIIDPFRRKHKLYSEEGQVVSVRPVARALGSTPSIAAIILNFPPPISAGQPSLLTLENVNRLFSKFGEALQQVLSSVNYLEVSGLNNVEWDAVHVTSNFMSYLLTDPDVIKQISGHYITKEPITVTELAPILGHMPGFHTCSEIYLANLDIDLHTSKEFWVGLNKGLWSEHFCLPMHKSDSFPLSFTSSISQGMSCAVYSRLWSKILAADAYNTFKNDADKNNIGERFRDTFLAFGGGCHPSEVFRRFQGRDPTPEAFIAATFPNNSNNA